MKNSILLFLSLLTLNLSAQTFGLKGGVAITNFSGSNADAEFRTGFYFGTFLKVGEENIKWSPELIFHQKGAQEAGNLVNSRFEMKLNYIDFSINANFHINDELSLVAGPYLGYATSGTIKTTTSGETNSESIDDWDGFNRIEFGTNLGAAYEINDLFHVDVSYGIAFTDIYDDISIHNTSLRFGIGYVFAY